jgi:N-formylglutamate amidohydrolase
MNRDLLKNSITGVYTLKTPDQCPPLVFDSPHSGRTYPTDFGYACDSDLLRRGEDNHVDQLLENTPGLGIPLLCGEFPRTYIDTNRALDDIEPEILAEPWPEKLNPTERAQSGIGLIRRYIKPGIFVYNRKLYVNEIQQRIENYYKPYHAALEALLDEARTHHGQVWHINWHSMPSLGSVTPFPRMGRRTNVGQPDFVLGDRNSTTCLPEFTRDVRDYLKDLGYAVAVNSPYKGVELVRRYSNPIMGRYSLQIEINKGLYWDERKIVKNKNFNALKADIEKFSQWLLNYTASRVHAIAAD